MLSDFSWNLETDNGSGGSKAEFVKFPEGITRVRVVDNAPYQRWTHYLNQFKRSVNCPGRGCPICEMRKAEKANKLPNKYNMTKRFAINVLNRETSRVEIMEQGKTFFQDLVDLRGELAEDGKSLLDVDIKVRRRGTGKDDTSYRLDLDKEYPLTDAEKKLIEDAVKLDEYFKPHAPEKIVRILNGEDWNTVMSENSAETPEAFAETIKDEDIELA